MKQFFFLFLFSFLFFDLFAQTKAGYSLIFQDEFSQSTMDTTKWKHRLPGALRVEGYNSIDNAFVKEGNLVISASYNPTNQKYYSGMIGTQETFQTTYGYFEASIKMQLKEGHWPAFWLQLPDIQSNCVNNPAVYGVEVDIVEYLRREGNKVRHTLHWDGYGSCHKSQENPRTVANCGVGFHTYAVEWTPTEYIFYVDNIETVRTHAAVSNRAEYMILSMEHGGWSGSVVPASCPDSVFFDYVRVYKKNSTANKTLPTNSLVVYPNPAQSHVTVSVPENEITGNTVKIYNLTGICVRTFPSLNINTTLYVQNLSRGIYFIAIPTKSGNQMKELVLR